MTTYETYENILNQYNWTGLGQAGYTQALPTTSISTDASGFYTLSYHFVADQNDLLSNGYYQSTEDEYAYFITPSQLQRDITETILHANSSYDYSYSVFFGDVAKVNFSTDTAPNSEIVIGQMYETAPDFLNQPNIGGYSYDYNPTTQPIEEKYGDVWFNEGFTGWDQGKVGRIDFHNVMHELGHALGLKGDNTLSSNIDNQKFTIMSYNLVSGMDTGGLSNDVTPSGLQLLDIAAIQEIYGREFSTRSGDTTYGISTAFSSTAINDAFIYTIWDGNGNDTISADGFYESGLGAGALSGAVIDLRQGEFSSIGSSVTAARATDNVAVAFHTIIEDAIGSVKGDLIIGNSWNNKLEGGSGNDTIYGDGIVYDGNKGFGAIANEHESESGVAADTNGSGDDELNGGLGNDTLYGGAGTDKYIYNLGDGNDVIIDSDSVDLVFGVGIDFSDLSVSQIGNDFIWNFADGGTVTIQDYYLNTTGATDTITYDGNQGGWAHAAITGQSLNGTDNSDVLSGSSGNDILSGGKGNDLLLGGAGNDKIYLDMSSPGNSGDDDRAYGGSGNDQIWGLRGSDYIDGGTGNDYIEAGWGDIEIIGAAGDDQILINGYGQQQVISGGAGNDIIDYAAYTSETVVQFNNYSAQIDGGAGDDYIKIWYGGDYTVDLGDGDDTFKNAHGSHNLTTVSTVTDTSGNDNYTIQAKDTSILDYQGNDRYFLVRGYGVTTIDDRDGSDYIDTDWKLFDNGSGSGALQKIRSADQMGNDLVLDMYTQNLNNSSTFGAHIVTIKDYYNGNKIESIKFSDVGLISLDSYISASLNSTNITGTSGDDVALQGTSNDDLIHALDGNDDVSGLSGDDIIFGGNGNDVIDAGDGNDNIYGGLGDDTLTGGTGNDSFIFESLAEITANTDHITDLELGDNINLSAIPGLIFIGNGSFTNTANEMRYVFENGSTAIEIDSTGDGVRDHRIIIDNGEFDIVEDINAPGTFKAIDNSIITGTSGDDILIGTNTDETISGLAGNDTIDGGGGVDTVDYSTSSSAVTVNIQSGTASDGEGGTDTLSGIENIRGSSFNDVLVGNNALDNTIWGGAGNDNVQGRAGSDTLYGDDGADTLKGANGDDVLHGGTGNDLIYGHADDDILYGGDGLDALWGHSGADTFVFEAASAYNERDNVKDFSLTDGDKIDLSDLLAGYDPIADLITDFVQITDNGTHSYVAVDADGGADNFQQVAQLSAITGLTDEATLEANGTLIV